MGLFSPDKISPDQAIKSIKTMVKPKDGKIHTLIIGWEPTQKKD